MSLISAAGHELRKRSWYYPVYKLLLRLRTPVVRVFTGLKLNENGYFGALYEQPEYRRHHFLHMPHYEFFPILGAFLVRNLKFIIGTILTIIGLYVAWVKR